MQKTLGLEHSGLLRDHSNLEGTANEEPAELSHAVHTECGIGLWSGKKPGSRAATFKKARSGRAAQVGIDTWAPNGESPAVGEWEGTEFNELTAGFLKSRFHFLMVPGHAKPLNPEGDGYIGKPVVDNLNALAKKIVPNFLGAP